MVDHTSAEFWQQYLDHSTHTERPGTNHALWQWLQKNRGLSPERGLDLGAGKGGDSLVLLNGGVKEVRAVDINTSHLQRLNHPGLKVTQSRIQDLKLEGSYDLVLAFYVLGFLTYEDLFAVLRMVHAHLGQTGIFVGNFFGLSDAWRTKESAAAMTFVPSDYVKSYLMLFREIISVNELNEEAVSDMGIEEHRHIFQFVAYGGRGGL